jgi:hypothetical protein
VGHLDPRASRRSGGVVAGGVWRGGRSLRSSAVAPAIRSTARSTASAVRGETVWTPLTFLTYCRAAARTSSLVAGGSRPLRVVMLRHMGQP